VTAKEPRSLVSPDQHTPKIAPEGNVSTFQSERVPPDRGDRIISAFAYIGVIPFLLFAGSPGRKFVRNHQHVAAGIHALRVVWTSFVLVFWWGFSASGDTDERLSFLARDITTVIVAGIPYISSFREDLLPWVLTPLVATWLLSLGGFVLAWSGRSADFHAFTHADWSDTLHRRRWFSRSPEEERRIARLARERHLERIQSSTKTYAAERARRERMESIAQELDQLRAQMEHNDQLLSLGEISQRRYDASRKAFDDDIIELERMRSGLVLRTTPSSSGHVPERLRVSRTDRSSEALVNTVAIVTPSGIPVFTFGSFHLDDAIVSGILSAFDSLSEEVFGSRVHKTHLSEGQVLYFAHGVHVLILAVFDDEPSPRQIELLKAMLRQFEQANQGSLLREQYDPQYLHQPAIPFKFTSAPTQTVTPPDD
jgi:hypothetical protein